MKRIRWETSMKREGREEIAEENRMMRNIYMLISWRLAVGKIWNGNKEGREEGRDI